MKKIHFENLGSLRTIAFFAIFLHHAFHTDLATVEMSAAFRWLEIVKSPAFYGVPFFFVLSGFLITYLILEEQRETGRLSIKNFYIRRILRIWPLYYAVLFFGFIIFPWLRQMLGLSPVLESADPLLYVLFLGNFDMIAKGLPFGVGLGPTWSLSVEEQFYVFWPLLLYAFSGRVGRKLMILSVIFFSVLGKHLLALEDANTIVCMVYLAVGALLADLLHEGHPFLLRLQRVGYAGQALIHSAGCGLIWLHAYFKQGGFYAVYLLLVSLYFAFVIYDQAISPNSLVKFGRFKLLETLGKYTYGFYLLHSIAIFISANLSRMLHPFAPEVLQALVFRPAFSLLLTVVLGVLSYHLFEYPIISRKKRFSVLESSA